MATDEMAVLGQKLATSTILKSSSNLTQENYQRRDAKTSVKATCQTFAGAAGGAVMITTIFPLDTVKVKMQTFPQLYNQGGVHCLKSVVKADGLNGLYKGLTPAIAAAVVESAILYTTYGVCQDMVKFAFRVDRAENMNMLHNACAGGLTGVLASFGLTPIDLIKCRLQAMKEVQASMVNSSRHAAEEVLISPAGMVRDVLRTEGIKGMFHGLTSTIVRNGPGNMAFFPIYEGLRSLMRRSGQTKDEIGYVRTMLCGGIGGGLYWGMVYPIDNIKSRIQVMSHNNEVQSFSRTVMNVVKNEGVKSLYNGCGLSMVRGFIGNAMLFMVYEKIKSQLLQIFDK